MEATRATFAFASRRARASSAASTARPSRLRVAEGPHGLARRPRVRGPRGRRGGQRRPVAGAARLDRARARPARRPVDRRPRTPPRGAAAERSTVDRLRRVDELPLDGRGPDPDRRRARRPRPRHRGGPARPRAQPHGRRRSAASASRVLGHPELGRTATRADGGLRRGRQRRRPGDAALRAPRLHPAQRQADAPWQDFAARRGRRDGALRRPGHRGRPRRDRRLRRSPGAATVTDGDGTRRATLLFAEGTDAEMVHARRLAREPLDDAPRARHRVHGRRRRPRRDARRRCPPTSGYTYAVELSVDEAVEAGATEVRFDKPVVDLRRELPRLPGRRAPCRPATYDREPARWVAAPNGRVIEIVGEAAGAAQVDADGDGDADTAASSPSSASPTAERERLAGALRPRREPVARRDRRTSRRGTSTGPTARRRTRSRRRRRRRRPTTRPRAEEGVLRRRLDHRLPEPAARPGAAASPGRPSRCDYWSDQRRRAARRPRARDPADRRRASRPA